MRKNEKNEYEIEKWLSPATVVSKTYVTLSLAYQLCRAAYERLYIKPISGTRYLKW